MDKNIPPIPPEDLELIGRYSRKAIPPEELYTFPLILCDNEIDRDGEKFTVDSLAKLAEMFRGKTGIFDHNPSGKEQTARIYSASLETDPARTAADGEPYTFVRAMAYMVRSEKNRDLIAEIDAGIKKETSVCCKVDAVRCSVCGRDIRRGPCPHEKGKEYDGKICCHLLCDPCDAYEWSFVAVPAQRNAGVTKSFQLSEMPSDGGVKLLRGEIAATAVKCNDESLRCGDASHPIVGADIIRPQQVRGKNEELRMSGGLCPQPDDESFQLSEEPPDDGVKLLRSEVPPCDGVKCIDSQCDSGSGESLRLSEMPSDDGVKSLRGEIAATAVKCNDESLRCGDASHPIVGADIIRPQQVRGKNEELRMSGGLCPQPDDESLRLSEEVRGKSEEERGAERQSYTTGCGASPSPDEVGFHCGGRNFTPPSGGISPRAHSARSDFTERKALISSLLPKSAPLPKEDTSVYII